MVTNFKINCCRFDSYRLLLSLPLRAYYIFLIVYKDKFIYITLFHLICVQVAPRYYWANLQILTKILLISTNIENYLKHIAKLFLREKLH